MENKFLKRFDLVKKKFNKKLKDNSFIEEIKAFKKYNILDENNMFNYIYIHEIYQSLIEKPLEYTINIISKNDDQITQLITKIFNEKDLDFNNAKNFSFSYKTYINFIDKNNNNFYNLYTYEKKEKILLLKNKSIKEILEYLLKEENKIEISEDVKENKIEIIEDNNENKIENNSENKNDIINENKDEIINENKNEEIDEHMHKKFLITGENYIFNSYPSIQFNFYFNEEYEDNITLIKQNIEKVYIEKNEKRLSLEKKILEKYFNNKNTLYLNDQIYYKNTTLLSTMNIFLYNEEEWEKSKESILEKINIKEIKGNKEIIINNIICNFKNNLLFFSDKEKERDLFNSNTSVDDENNFNLIEFIYKQIYTHFKNEMNFIKTSLLNFNSLINDHMKITFDENNPLKNNEDIADYLRNSIFSLIASDEEAYLAERQKMYDNFINNSKNEIINNLNAIKQEIDQKYLITNNTFDYLQSEITKWMANYEKQIFDFMKGLDNLNIKIFYDFKKNLNEQGIFSINFDGLIKVVAVERISIKDPIKDLIQTHKNSFGRILATFGISGVVGGTASFLAGRAASVIGADAAAGTFGGPIGIGVGVVVGFGTLIGQAGYHYKKNRELINNVYDDMNKNVLDTINKVEDSIQKEMNKINDSMEKDIQEIKDFIKILIDRVIKLFA